MRGTGTYPGVHTDMENSFMVNEVHESEASELQLNQT